MAHKLISKTVFLSVWVYEKGSRCHAAAHLRVVTPGVVQQSETDLMQPLDFTGVVVETLEGPTADIPWTHQATLNLSWERQKHGQKDQHQLPHTDTTEA